MNRFLASDEETPNAFGSWFAHVAAFEGFAARLGPERACVVEYETMHADLRGCLTRLAKLLGPQAVARLETEGTAIECALGFSEMKASGASPHIMRKGQAGGWREHFSEEDEARMAEAVKERLPRTAESVVG